MRKSSWIVAGSLLSYGACSSSPQQSAEDAKSSAGGTSEADDLGDSSEEDDEAGGSASGGSNATASGGSSSISSGGSSPVSGGATGDGDTGGAAETGVGGKVEAGGGSPNDGGSASTGGASSSTSADPTPSSGCGQSLTLTSGRKTIDVDGTEREYIVKLPDDYNPDHPYRLIFGFHGRNYDADWVANGEPPLTGPYFGIEAEAQGQAIFVAGQALSSSWTNEGGRDIDYVQTMVDYLSAEVCVDKSRMFATGFSYGAIMTLSVGCELGAQFRAIAPMSGATTNGCPDSTESVAYWASHGLSDPTILPVQGEAARDVFVGRNHCDSTTVPSSPEGCVSYEGCDSDAPVSWCTFDGVHEPPPFAGTAIWQFFSQF